MFRSLDPDRQAQELRRMAHRARCLSGATCRLDAHRLEQYADELMHRAAELSRPIVPEMIEPNRPARPPIH